MQSLLHYKILRELRSGGMGVVYEAQESQRVQVSQGWVLYAAELHDEAVRMVKKATRSTSFGNP